MNHPTNPPVDWETLVTQEENRLYREFEGTLSYQEGVRNTLFLRWSRGYSDVTVRVSLPESGTPQGNTVDVSNPPPMTCGSTPFPGATACRRNIGRR